MAPDVVTGWGRTMPAHADALTATGRDREALARTVKSIPPRGGIARGLGRSYGDAAQRTGGVTLRLRDSIHDVVLDPGTATATVPGGVDLDELTRLIVPRGFFVPVTAGTRYVTVGGAIASDIHGKNHHVDGSFGSHVRRLSLLLADGDVVEVGPDRDPELFWATVGGMGLTGIILDATVELLPIETSRCSVDTTRTADLDSLLALMEERDRDYRYSVAWVDLLAKGANLGRSILIQGDFATVNALPDGHRWRVDALHYHPMQPVPAPPLPSGLLNRLTIRAANEVWFRKAPKRRRDELQSITRFFYPLDLAGDWSRVYGRQGFLQWQCLIPFGHEDTLREVVESLANQDAGSFLTVLKYFGAADPGYLSFPGPGWTLSLDVPSRCAGLAELLDRLDRQVAGVGGRLYFAKDSRMRPDLVPVMYPQLGEWREIRERMDPDRRLVSDLARRLHLLG
jgi:decaprenylphospho-beta-D-ribofuranose 2-oxidase